MKLVTFGDSITAGAGASNTTKSYAPMLAAALSATLTNNGVSTAMALDEGGALFSTTMTPDDVAAVMFGTNDQAKYGTDPAKRGFFIDALRAYLIRLAAGSTNATPANGVAFSGAWNNGYAYSTYGATATGAKATFSVSGDAVALGLLRQYNNTGTFKVKIDGVDRGTFSNGGDVRTILGAAFGPMALLFSGLGAGQHTIEVEVLSANSTNSVVFLQWFAAITQKNLVVVGNIPHAIAYTYGGSQSNVDAYNSSIAAMVSELSLAGLDVRLIDVCSVLTASDMADNVHPNDTGHSKIATAFSEALTKPSSISYTSVQLLLGTDSKLYIQNGTSITPLTDF